MKKIIIADDSKTMRGFLTRILTDAGYEIVAEAVDGVAVVEKYIKYKPDLVILDITMPGLSGLDALKHILRMDNKAKVIMCSSMMGQSHHIDKATQNGAVGFITKPFNPGDVVKVVNKVFAED